MEEIKKQDVEIEETNNVNEEAIDTNIQQQSTFAGKFKSVEELEKAYQEAQRMLQEASERAKRAEETLNVFLSSVPTTTSTNEEKNNEEDNYYSKVLENPKEVFKKFSEEIEKRMINLMQQKMYEEKAQQQIRDYFYSKYPDLKGYEPIVSYFADINEKKYKPLAQTDLQKLLDIIAQDTRSYIASKIQTNIPQQNVINVAEPQKVKNVSKKVSEDEDININPDEELHNYLKERQQNRIKKTLR